MDSELMRQALIATEQFRQQFGHLREIYHIAWGNRFGEPVIGVDCVTYRDMETVKDKIPLNFQGFRIHILGPMWKCFTLIPELAKQEIEMVNDPFYTSTEDGQKKMSSFFNKGIARERTLWESWSDVQQKAFISTLLNENRKHDPKFGNCADKFLT